MQSSFRTIPYPLAPCPPIAVFSKHFAEVGPVRIAMDPSKITSLKVRTAAAPLPILHALADYSWAPDYPLIVLSDVRNGLISDEDRDDIWSTFGVPVFEYLLDGEGWIAARECEAHEGLHFTELPDYLSIEVTKEACPCGKPGPRLLQMRVASECANAIIGG